MSKRYYEWSLLLLRLVLGIVFLAHGWQKITGFEGVAHFFASLGLPWFLVYAVTAIETVGGACLLLGLFTRLAATGISAVLLGAIVTVKGGAGFINGYEFELTLLVIAIALILSGSHRFTVAGLWQSSNKE